MDVVETRNTEILSTRQGTQPSPPSWRYLGGTDGQGGTEVILQVWRHGGNTNALFRWPLALQPGVRWLLGTSDPICLHAQGSTVHDATTQDL